jgi:hypothetical protein
MQLISDEAPKPALVPKNKAAPSEWISGTWGWLPILSLTSGVGVFLLALADEAGRFASHWADLLFWIGLLVLFIPIAVRIISPGPSRQERIALLVILGSSLYLLRYLEEPLAFGFNDEFLMWRVAQNISESGRLFLPSPLLSISPFYPGLEIVTSALSSLTGLYTAKPTFFADTLFHYENLAMPLVAFVLFLIIRRSHEPKDRRMGLTLVIGLGIAAIIVTHHVASYLLDLFLIFWTSVYLILKLKTVFRKNRDQEVQASPGWAALIAIVLSAAWLAYTGARAVGYLYPSIQTTVNEFVQTINGEAAAHQFFHTATGFVEPLWERVAAFAAVGLVCLGLPFGLFLIWRHYRTNAAVLALAAGALAYPVSLLIHLTAVGVDLGGRLQPYVFASAAFVLAIAITHFWLSRKPSWRYRALLLGSLVVIFIGGWVTGTSPIWDRLPGPYQPYADQNSIQPEGVTAAEWAGSHLAPGQRIISTDQVNTILMATYGHQWVVTSANDNILVAIVFTTYNIGLGVEKTLQQGRVHYVVVDYRMVGVQQDGYPQPIEAAMLEKFNGVQNVSRIYDSGNIVIYDVEALSSGTSTTTSPPPALPCILSPSTGVPGSYQSLAKLYTGTLYDVPKNLVTKISLTGIQQQRGAICGYLNGGPANGPFTGTIAANGHLQFLVTGEQGQATYSFDGSLTPEGLLVGTYCVATGPSAGQCSDYGLWSVSPAKSGE